MRFSVLRCSITGFLEVGVWNRFVGFWVNTVGFSTALLLDLHQSGILQFPQGVDRFLPSAVEQLHYLVDGIVEVNPPVFVCPAIFPGQVCPAQDKGVQNLCLVRQGLECGGFKEKIREPGEAERLFRLMNVNGVCHIVFCGRLEARFPGRAILSLLTVHSRPPFPFTFCFLPPVNSGGTAGAVFSPVGFRDEHAAADRTAFQVLIPENLRFQRPVQRQNRPSEPLAADRERNRLRAGAGVPIVKNNAVAVLKATALPAYQAGRLFPLRRCHAVKGTVRPAFQWRQVFIGVISHAFPPFCFPLPFLRKGFLPHSCGVFPTWGPTKSSDFVGRGAAAERVSFRHLAEANDTQLAATRHAPRSFGTTCPEVTSGQSVQKLAPCSASPAGVFLFGRSFCFQGAVHR